MKPSTIELTNQKNQHIVWLDVVRLIAMFTVVCCHCTDPFNFYPGTAPNIGEIKLWGAIYGSVILDFFPYAGEEVMQQSFSVAVQYILAIPFNFSVLAVHMWYIYLLIGLYLFCPYSRHGWKRLRSVLN